jgi:HK97 family phage portal protein
LGIFGRIKRFTNLSLNDPKAWDEPSWALRGALSLSGEHVDEYTALTSSPIYNAVTLIAGTVSTLPLHLLSKKGNTTTIQESLSAHAVLYRQANEYMTAQILREVMMGHILLWGNGYAEIVRDGYGNVVALWPITPNRVKIKWKDDAIVYEIRMDKGEDLLLSRDKVLHIPGPGFDGMQGYSVISLARRGIGLTMALETFGSKYFGEGTHPGVVVEHPGKLSSEAHANLKGSLTEAHSGLGKAHRLMLLEEGMKLQNISIQPEDSQFLQTRQFQIPEIARWFNLPPHKLKDLTRSSFSNIESEQISFVTDSILPWLIRLESNYNIQLLNKNEQRRLFYRHNVDGLLRGSARERGEFYRLLWNVGAININEIREKENMDPIEGGNEYFVPMNMVPLSRALEEPKEPKQIPFQPEPVEGNGNGKAIITGGRHDSPAISTKTNA